MKLTSGIPEESAGFAQLFLGSLAPHPEPVLVPWSQPVDNNLGVRGVDVLQGFGVPNVPVPNLVRHRPWWLVID